MLANNPNAEIAFFGGSFTLIEHDYMIDLLKSATEFVNKGLAKSIRFSTRPDAKDIRSSFMFFPLGQLDYTVVLK